MSKQQYGEQYVEFLLGSLSPALAEKLSRHAEECPECEAELKQIEEVLHSLALAAPQHAPPAELKGRILESVRSTARGEVKTFPRARRPRLVLGWALAASLAAAVGLATSVALYLRGVEQVERVATLEAEVDRLQQANQSLDLKVRQITAPATRFMTLAGLEGYGQIQGRAFVDPETGRARIFLRSLPVLPTDRVFQLWFIEPGVAPHPSVVFTPATPFTEVEADLTIAPDLLANLAVSIEPPGGSLSPTGPIVALGQF